MIFFVCSFYAASSILLTLSNKYIYSKYSFNKPLTVNYSLPLQMLILQCLLNISIALGLMTVKTLFPKSLTAFENINLPISTLPKMMKKLDIGLMIGFFHAVSVIFGQFAV